jgi:hypothetical protein
MTQDPNGQPPAAGNVIRGEVIPDDEGNVVPPTVPMTRFQRVASVDAPGSLRGRHAAGETPPEDVVAVRSPDAGDHDDWDDPDETDGTDGTDGIDGVDGAGLGQTADQAQPDATDTQDPALADEPGADAADAAADEAPRQEDADAPATAAEALRPGEPDGALVYSGDLAFGRLLPDAAEFRTRWQQVQFRFVDDPRGSVTEAADVISQLTAKLEAAIAERQRALRDRWDEGSADTESLRGTLLAYRAFLDQLIG